jgi:hypothetical protein
MGQVNLGSLIELEFDEPYAAVPAVGARKAGFGQIKPTERQTAKISLNDCLACSGCITSAETVLIQQQSLAEFYTALTDASRVNVVTVSPQARAALAARFNLSILQVRVYMFVCVCVCVCAFVCVCVCVRVYHCQNRMSFVSFTHPPVVFELCDRVRLI